MKRERQRFQFVMRGRDQHPCVKCVRSNADGIRRRGSCRWGTEPWMVMNLRYLRQLKFLKNEPETTSECLTVGAEKFLMKSCPPQQIIPKLQGAMSLHKSTCAVRYLVGFFYTCTRSGFKVINLFIWDSWNLWDRLCPLNSRVTSMLVNLSLATASELTYDPNPSAPIFFYNPRGWPMCPRWLMLQITPCHTKYSQFQFTTCHRTYLITRREYMLAAGGGVVGGCLLHIGFSIVN